MSVDPPAGVPIGGSCAGLFDAGREVEDTTAGEFAVWPRRALLMLLPSKVAFWLDDLFSEPASPLDLPPTPDSP